MSKTLHYRTPELEGVRSFIAIPAYSGIAPGVGFSLFKTASEINSYMELHILTEYCHVDDARNTMVNSFLESDCDQLIFIDADTYWEPENLQKLIDYPQDIVAGVIPKKSDSTEFNVRLMPGDQVINDGLLEVSGIGTAFMKIRRHVLEDLAKESQYFYAPNYKNPIHVIFERSIGHDRRFGGDITFCEKAKAKGYKIYVDPDMRFGHYGENYWEGRFMDHLFHQNGKETPKFLSAIEDVKSGSTSNDAFISLWEHWGNTNWSAGPDLLMSLYFLSPGKTVLECGSGLSTIIMALGGAKVYALEHDYRWYTRVKRIIKELNLNAEVIYSPVKEYSDFLWYDHEKLPKPRKYDMIVIDGPPREIGRNGVFNIFDVNNAIVVADDTKDMTIPGHDTMVMDGIKPFVISRPQCLKKSA